MAKPTRKPDVPEPEPPASVRTTWLGAGVVITVDLDGRPPGAGTVTLDFTIPEARDEPVTVASIPPDSARMLAEAILRALEERPRGRKAR